MKKEDYHIRCTPEFKNIIKSRSERLGIPMTALIEDALLCPYYVVADVPEDFKEIKRELNFFGRNLNQLVKSMNEINRVSRQYHDINLLTDSETFRELAVQASSLQRDFEDFCDQLERKMRDLVTAPKKVYWPDIQEQLDQDPDYLKNLEPEKKWQL